MKPFTKTILSTLFAGIMLCAVPAFSQQSNWWHFGNGCSIDFNSGSPVPGTSSINHLEGTASISNASGQPLFYTNGIKVFKPNGNIMLDINSSNAYLMSGNNSTSQTIIVPKPGTSLYYIFTVGTLGSSKIKYSVVDLTSPSGVVTSINNALPDPTGTALNDSEKMTAVKHCNGTDYWVITHETANNRFKVFLVSNAGIGNPVISNQGANDSGGSGSLKVSPDGRVIGFSQTNNRIELFDFNRSSGTISFKKTVDTGSNGIAFYGLEFSPNSRYLYYAGTNHDIRRYDLSLPNNTPVVITPNGNGGTYYGFQLAPNGNIYISSQNQSYLSGITNADAGGTFTTIFLALAPGTTSTCGLPNFAVVNAPGCATASFIFTNEGQMERSVNTLYGPQIITEVCLPHIYIDGSASSNENGYFLEIRKVNDLMTWSTTVVYSNWINIIGQVPPGNIDITQYYNLFIPGTDYLVTLSVGPEWSSMARLLRPKNCPPTACFVFSGNVQQSTANEGSPYGPQQVTSVCLPTVKIDGSCSMNETGYHLQIDPFDLNGWLFLPTNYYNGWVSNTLPVPNSINLTQLIAQNNHTFLLNTVYRIALSVGNTPQTWNTMAKFLRVNDCRGSVQFEEVTPEEIQAMQNGETASVLIYPNPTDGQFNVNFGNQAVQHITVSDVVGKVVLDQGFSADTATAQIDLSGQPSGVYFVRVLANNKTVIKKIVKN